MSFKRPTNLPVGRGFDALTIGDDLKPEPVFDPGSSHVGGAGRDGTETVRIVSQDPSQGAFVVINAADFDPAVHEVYQGDEAVETPLGRYIWL